MTLNKHYQRLFLTGIALFSITIASLAQDRKRQVAVGLNYSSHGSGDMGGMLLNFDYSRFYTKKLAVVYNLGMSLHGSKAIPYNRNQNSTLPDYLRTDIPQWVTAGIQVSSILQYHFAKRAQTGLHVGVGPVLRYQLNSYPLSYTYYGEQNPWFPQPFYVFQEVDNKRINLGYQVRLGYDFALANNKHLGINSFFQNDTNGDTLVGLGLSFGLGIK